MFSFWKRKQTDKEKELAELNEEIKKAKNKLECINVKIQEQVRVLTILEDGKFEVVDHPISISHKTNIIARIQEICSTSDNLGVVEGCFDIFEGGTVQENDMMFINGCRMWTLDFSRVVNAPKDKIGTKVSDLGWGIVIRPKSSMPAPT